MINFIGEKLCGPGLESSSWIYCGEPGRKCFNVKLNQDVQFKLHFSNWFWIFPSLILNRDCNNVSTYWIKVWSNLIFTALIIKTSCFLN